MAARKMKICVIGCGAVGSLFAAHLAKGKESEVFAFDVSPAHVQAINQQYEAIHSMSATVEFQATEGGSLKGREKTYISFSGYILLRKPESLRVLGLWKSMSFAAVHRLLLLGVLGVLMNVVSGMLMMLADSYRYVVNDYTFAPKIALIPIGATAVLYFSVSDRLWNVKAGEDAPAAAKWVAALVLLAWAGVIVCGRLLAYL